MTVLDRMTSIRQNKISKDVCCWPYLLSPFYSLLPDVVCSLIFSSAPPVSRRRVEWQAILRINLESERTEGAMEADFPQALLTGSPLPRIPRIPRLVQGSNERNPLERREVHQLGSLPNFL